MNKFIKTLIVINGILFPILIGITFYQMLVNNNHESITEDGVIIGEEFEEAKQDSLQLQGIEYESPIEIYNSTNFYLPISALTYDEAKNLKELVSSAAEVSYSLYQLFNILFLTKDYDVIGTLVDRKASIIDIDFPRYSYRNDKIDKTVNNIVYLISFDDTNNDGKLNSLDFHDLYISDLNGKNLTQVTKGVDVESFEFVKSNSELFIRFRERNEQREEHRKVKFAIFKIKSATLIQLSGLNDTLDIIESSLIN